MADNNALTQPYKIEIRDLRQNFTVSQGLGGKKAVVKAVDGVSFYVKPGETLGLVGESGCGKTTLGKTMLHLLPPKGGDVFFNGLSLKAMNKNELRRQRLKMQIVFQDPFGSLNARMSVGAILQEPLLYHKLCSKSDSQEKVEELLRIVGLRPFHAHRYPHEFSGGQRQRIAIARALTVNPEFIVCDEPVSALDVSVQSQILNLFSDLKEQLNLTYLFISHDLSVVRHISDRIGVMYLGKLVELADENELFIQQLHPYTRTLFAAMPSPRAGAKLGDAVLKGSPPSPLNPPPGCSFHQRCEYAKDICKHETPDLIDIGNGHMIACHLHNEIAGGN